MTNGFSAALSSTASTSSPIMVSLSTISSSEASVSRWSFSQERVNFIVVSAACYAALRGFFAPGALMPRNMLLTEMPSSAAGHQIPSYISSMSSSWD